MTTLFYIALAGAFALLAFGAIGLLVVASFWFHNDGDGEEFE